VRLAGQALWQAYFANIDVRNVRDEFKLNRPDVGWYQIRNALKSILKYMPCNPISMRLTEPLF